MISKIFIVEGIDNVGKGTLIESIITNIGFHQIIKFDKPKKCKPYNNSLKTYQEESFLNSFSLLSSLLRPGMPTPPRLIFDRFHLGELVYSPLYRGYSGDYVFSLEKSSIGNIGPIASANIRLILLTADQPELLPDDGKSFDPTKAHSEQSMFIDGFKQSCIKNKVMVQVQNPDGSFKDPNRIFEEAVGISV